MVTIFSLFCDFRRNISCADYSVGDIYRDILPLAAPSLLIGVRIQRRVTSRTHFSSLSVTGIRYRYLFGNVNVDYVHSNTRSNSIMLEIQFSR